MDDSISRQAAIDHWRSIIDATSTDNRYDMGFVDGLEFCISDLSTMPSAQPQYEELTPEEVASEIASGSTMTAWYWLDDMIRIKQMGYVICKKTM